LAAGGAEARERLAAALTRLTPDAESLFEPVADEAELLASGVLPEPLTAWRARWRERLAGDLAPLGLSLPETSGELPRRGTPSEDFGWLWGEFTSVVRSGAGTTW
jgi:1,2-phenylacetyl-CoA epoxidase catalytic subunit